MATPQTRSETSLRLERVISAPPARVYAAWTKAETLARWMAPTDDYTVVVTALDARPGGVWRLEMRHPAGAVHAVHGSYRTLEAPSKLSFTWSWEEDAAVRDTLVTVEFHPEGDGTRIVLVHELLPNAESRDKHEAGWIGCLARLPRGI